MEQKSFRRQLGFGVLYTAMAKYSGIVISLIVTAILSRLLTPADFGIVAVTSVFIIFFSILSDMGLGSAIIQKRDLSREDYRSLFTWSFYLGILLAGIFFCCSWLIARIYDNKLLIPLCQILSVNVLFATWNIIPNGLLLHHKQFKYIGMRTLIIQVSLAVGAISAAYLGAGVYALLINPVGTAILTFALSYMKYPVRLILRPGVWAVKKVASYSAFTFGFSLINYFTRNLDKLMIGKVFGLAPLGYYEKSYRLMLLPVQNLTHVITPVLHPVLADYQESIGDQIKKYLNVVKILALVGFPITAFLYFSAKDLILIIFGSQWIPSVEVFKILSLTVGLQITGSTTGALYQATNRTKEMFIIGVLNTLLYVSGLFIGIYAIGTIEGVAWMWVATMYIGLWNNIYMARIYRIPILETFQPYLPAILPTIIVGVLLFLVNISLSGIGLFLPLILKILITGIILLWLLNKYGVVNLRKIKQKIVLRVIK